MIRKQTETIWLNNFESIKVSKNTPLMKYKLRKLHNSFILK